LTVPRAGRLGTPALTRLAAPPGAHARLLCIPHAGGSALVFRPWAALLPAGVELWAVQAAGRGDRMAEPPHDRIEPLVDEVLAAEPRLPIIVFGHSMGALVGFELARAARRAGLPLPEHLFVAGHPAPQLPPSRPPTEGLPDAEFIERLSELGGTPEEALRHPELMEVFLPVLRADFGAVEAYAYRDEPPLACPITAVGGEDDRFVAPEELSAWRAQTVRRFALELMPGGHFFLTPAAAAVVALVTREWTPVDR
jgi:surfactin synthase thioesterase subunit